MTSCAVSLRRRCRLQGPVFATAIVAGVMAVKKTAELIPFCHPIPIEKCDIKVCVAACDYASSLCLGAALCLSPRSGVWTVGDQATTA